MRRSRFVRDIAEITVAVVLTVAPIIWTVSSSTECEPVGAEAGTSDSAVVEMSAC